MKATLLCFMPVAGWAVYQETELYKIRNDDSYLEEILQSADSLSSNDRGDKGQGVSRDQFMKQFNSKMNAEESAVKKRLEEEAYAALK